MQSAETVLKVIQKRGIEEKPLKRVYRQLFNKDMYKLAYSEIYANKGAITKGINEDTLDGMSEEEIDKIIQNIRSETYKWKPARRTHIPKPKGGKRPLGIPTGNDKLVQSTLKILLETYYEPRFSNRSHGFRPGRGCHTALKQIDNQHQSANWFIEGDIKGCFDSIDHEILLDILSEDIHDGRFINLLRTMMKAGHVEDWKWHKTVSGTPQGGIISPLLSNIYLNKLDQWIETELMPQWNFDHRGKKGRKRNPLYVKYSNKRTYAKLKGDHETYKHYGKLMKTIPSLVDDDEDRRNLEYIRYADDFLLSFSGQKKEAREIKERISEFLERDLKLKLSNEKTLITHAKTEKARFLGYELRVRQSDERRKANGSIWFGVPKEVIAEAMKKYSKRGKPAPRAELLENSDYDIISNYQAEYRGLVQYYIMAHNLHLLNRLEWVIVTSMLRTLAWKHRSTTNQIAKKHRATKKVGDKTYRIFQVIVNREDKKPLTAYLGAIPLIRNPEPQSINDNIRPRFSGKSEILQRMMKEKCEMCGEKGKIQVHHIRGLKDLNKPGKKAAPTWVVRMSALRRKTLMVCTDCHKAIHAGKHRVEWNKSEDSVESRVQ